MPIITVKVEEELKNQAAVIYRNLSFRQDLHEKKGYTPSEYRNRSL